MFSLQGPDGPPGKLGLPGEVVRKMRFIFFPFLIVLEEVYR